MEFQTETLQILEEEKGYDKETFKLIAFGMAESLRVNSEILIQLIEMEKEFKPSNQDKMDAYQTMHTHLEIALQKVVCDLDTLGVTGALDGYLEGLEEK